MTEIRDKFANPRRSVITHDPGEMGVEDLIDDEEIVVTMTRAGYIKSVAAAAFRTQGRGGRGVQGARLKEEDLVDQVVHTSAHAYLLLFSNRGKVYRLRGHEIPMKERTARGTAVVNLRPAGPQRVDHGHHRARGTSRADQFLVFATTQGQVKKTAFSEYDKSRREGFIAINLRDGDELVRVVATSGDDDLFEVTRNGMTIRFSEQDVRAMGRDAAGVRGIRLRDGRRGRVVRRRGRRHRHPDRDRRRLRQADQARALQPPGPWRPGRARHPADRRRGARSWPPSWSGSTTRSCWSPPAGWSSAPQAREIASQGRDATGVRVMNLDDGQTVAAVARVCRRRPTRTDARLRRRPAQKRWSELSGQTRRSTLPTMSDLAIGPQYRLSHESLRLSPMTK